MNNAQKIDDLFQLVQIKIETAAGAISSLSATDSDLNVARSVRELTEALKTLYELKEKEGEEEKA